MSECTPTHGEEGGEPVSFDTVLDVCRDPRRRIVLAVLAAEMRSLTVRDLTRAVVQYNRHARLTEVSEEVVTQVHTALHHLHLPTLEAVGFIEYDTERRIVDPTEQLERVRPSLSAVIEADPTLELPVPL